MHVIVVVIVCLMLARMWSCGIELHLYDHDVSVACINGDFCLIMVGWLFF